MTDAEARALIDEAVAILKTTTVGYAGHSAAWRANQSTAWWKGLNKLDLAKAALDPVVPPPPPPSGPLTITKGGIYVGSWTSVVVNTVEPVLLQDSVVAGQGRLIQCQPGPVDVTVRRVKGLGGTGRFFYAEAFKQVTLENNTIEKTSGISLAAGAGKATVSKNRFSNVQREANGDYRQFLQVNGCQQGGEVSWNWVTNDYQQSEVEDVISVYGSSNFQIIDNFLYGGYPASPTAGSSSGGITIEGGSNGIKSSLNVVDRNQVVAMIAKGIGFFAGADRCVARDNTVVSDARTDDGTILFTDANVGLVNMDAVGCRMTGNRVGWVRGDGKRNNMYMPACPSDYVLNTELPDPITHATEQAEQARWLAKIAAAGVKIGA